MLRFKLFALTLSSASLLLLFLCLGSQNLNQRINLNLGVTSTAPLPSGFIVGVSFILGVISGGSTSILLTTSKILEE